MLAGLLSRAMLGENILCKDTALHPAPLGPLGALSFALAGSMLTIPLAWLCYRGVERPGRHLIRRSPRRIVSYALR